MNTELITHVINVNKNEIMNVFSINLRNHIDEVGIYDYSINVLSNA